MIQSAYENDTVTKKPTDEHIQSSLVFIQSHENILNSLNKATCINESFKDTDIKAYPVKFTFDTVERVLAQDLIFTDNEIIRKAVTVLVFLCDEINQLKDIAESKFYRSLMMFGCNASTTTTSSHNEQQHNSNNTSSSFEQPGNKEYMIGKFLPFLQELSNFIDRCYSVCLNLVQQVASLMNPNELLYRSIFEHTHLPIVSLCLGDLLTILISLDAIIKHNQNLDIAWTAFKLMITLVRSDEAAFETSSNDVAQFERLLVSIDQNIMIGEILKGCIEQNFEDVYDDDDTENAIKINVRYNRNYISNELLYSMKLMLESALLNIGTNMESIERIHVVGAVGIYALYRHLLPPKQQPDAKLHSSIWSIQTKVPVVIICDSIMWLIGEFLMSSTCYLEVKKLDPINPEAHRRQFIQQFDQSLNQRSMALIAQCKAWMVLVDSKIVANLRIQSGSDEERIEILSAIGNILLKGISISHRIKSLTQTFLVMHSAMQVPLTTANLHDVSYLLETLKGMEYTLTKKDHVIAELFVHIMRFYSDCLYNTINPIKQKLQGIRKVDSHQVLMLTVVILLEHLVKSSDVYSQSRQVLLSILSEIIASAPSTIVTDKEKVKIRSLVMKITMFSNMSKHISTACDTSFLYHHTDILSVILRSIYSVSTEANTLRYILSAFEDGVKLCRHVLHATDPAAYVVGYREVLKQAVYSEIIEPLCRDIETDLRLHIHTKHLDHMQTVNPKTENLRPLRCYLDLPPLHIIGLLLDIKAEVTHYLNVNFYNLTTVALHDWRTYSDMKSLATEKLGLHLMDNYLPMGSLDQGLDVLQIMRNIHVFVSRFTYNMNMQQFVEYRPDKASKHLNTIKIQSIAASIRQHGLGVLNTTVNFTYQFLSSKFHIFNQFLFDDYIRAHLSREHRWFKKHKNQPEINNRYPYERALKFVREIRKLGVNDTNKSFLDQFRILITEIGNALGYVRMVRSASMYYCSEAVKFLPEFEDIISFKTHAGTGTTSTTMENETLPTTTADGANYCEETVRAAENLDNVINTLVKNFGEGSDYFKVLVNVFQSVLLNSDHDHLRNFYIIVPALCISWIDASLVAKDAMYKTARGGSKEMYFTDDGFPVGIAYCLAILKQSRKNESLHWIESVNEKVRLDTKDLEEQKAKRAMKEAEKLKSKRKSSGFFGFGNSSSTNNKSKSKSNVGGEDDEDFEKDYEEQEEIHTLQMSSKKLEAFRRESEQLFYSMSGAEIFFKRTDVET